MGLHHVGIAVKDMEKSVTFYRDVIGLTVFQEEVLENVHIDRAYDLKDARFRMVLLTDESGNMVELFGWENPTVRERPPEYRDFTSRGIIEVCFMVNSLDEVEQRMKQHGYSYRSPVWPFGRDSNIYGGAWAEIRYLKGPDGENVELMQVVIPQG